MWKPDPENLNSTALRYGESFNAALKNELVYRTQYPTRERAYRDIARYIEFWYNASGGLG